MTHISEHDAQVTTSPFAGLVPTRLRLASAAEASETRTTARERSRLAMSMFNTVPIVLVGSMAMAGMSFSGVIEPVESKRPLEPKSGVADLSVAAKSTIKQALAEAHTVAAVTETDDSATAAGEVAIAAAPSTYRVQGGDTVSGIAGRYGLSTASVLALNGLGWKSVIFPGQVLKLSKAATTIKATPVSSVVTAPSTSSVRYTIRKGDTISGIAKKYGVSTQSLLTANSLSWSSVIYAGRTLQIPGSSTPTTTAPVSKPVAAAPAPVVVAPVVSTPAPSAGTSATVHTIKSGDTLSAIAKKYGVTVQSILANNGLSLSSTIYAGRTLKISATIQVAETGSRVTPLSPEMQQNATTIVRVGQELGVPEYGLVIALAAAMQESSLRNINYGDRDSLGLFQQRPSSGWGSPEQLLTPTHAARLFYGGPSNPNVGNTRGLLDIKGWQSMTVTQAAQKVQISAFPDAYAKWETSARAWLKIVQ